MIPLGLIAKISANDNDTSFPYTKQNQQFRDT